MYVCDLTFPEPARNLAADEALLEWAEQRGTAQVLRFWEPANYFVVVGYSNRVSTEVNVALCTSRRIPILRRCTGGGTVLQGPGCLNYSLVLRIDSHPDLSSISSTNSSILSRNCAALSSLLESPVDRRGHTDMVMGNLKFSGNAQRRKRECLLFHGTLLLDMDLKQIERVLPMPSQEPEYRQHRSHLSFLTNLHCDAASVKAALAGEWNAAAPLEFPREAMERLVEEKYSKREWNFKF